MSVYFGDKRVQHRKKQVLAPGEMEQVILKKADIQAAEDLSDVTVRIEQD